MTATHYLMADLSFACTEPDQDTDDAFDAFTDAVADELYNLADVDDGIIDPDLTVCVTERTASILMGIEASSDLDAVRLFSANLRAALHAAGCRTADWPVFKPTTQTPPVREAEYTDA